MWVVCVFFLKQKTAYEMRISDWSSDVCSSDLPEQLERDVAAHRQPGQGEARRRLGEDGGGDLADRLVTGQVGNPDVVDQVRDAVDLVRPERRVVQQTRQQQECVRHGSARLQIGRASCRARVGQDV